MCWRWNPQVAVVECWGKWLVLLTTQLAKRMYPNRECEADCGLDEVKEEPLREVWLRMFQLMGDPAEAFEHCSAMITARMMDPSNSVHFQRQAGLCLFIHAQVFSWMVDVFQGMDGCWVGEGVVFKNGVFKKFKNVRTFKF